MRRGQLLLSTTAISFTLHPEISFPFPSEGTSDLSQLCLHLQPDFNRARPLHALDRGLHTTRWSRMAFSVVCMQTTYILAIKIYPNRNVSAMESNARVPADIFPPRHYGFVYCLSTPRPAWVVCQLRKLLGSYCSTYSIKLDATARQKTKRGSLTFIRAFSLFEKLYAHSQQFCTDSALETVAVSLTIVAASTAEWCRKHHAAH